jgi:tRNA(Ile)-lysidine synthase
MSVYLENKVSGFIKFNGLIEPQDNVLAALSGGADSVFMLFMLKKLQRLLKFSLSAMHVNHNLRGEESRKDEIFCRELCRRENIEFFSASVDVKTFAREKSISIEESARILRYRALSGKAAEAGAAKIATAHNLNDNAETVLLNLFKGKGLNALSGIPSRRDNIIRPILSIDRTEIIDYLTGNDIQFRIDSSNASDIYQRNFIRNKLTPLIKENINPKFEAAVWRSSEILRADAAALEELLSKIYNNYVYPGDDFADISLDVLQDYGTNVAVELVKRLFWEVFGKEFRYSDKIHITDLFGNQVGKKIILSDNIEIFRERDKLRFQIAREYADYYTELKIGESVQTPMGLLRIDEISLSETEITNDGRVEFASADSLNGDFIVRNWKYGDKFFPLGMTEAKKISDFLTDSKLPASNRAGQLALINDNKIVWVIGQRLDNRYKIDENTKRVIKLWMS